MAHDVTLSNHSISGFFFPSGKFDRAAMVRIGLVVFSLLLIGGGIALYFKGEDLFTKVTYSVTSRALIAGVIAISGIGIDLRLLWNYFSRKQEAQKIEPKELHPNSYFVADEIWNEKHYCLLALGETTYNQIVPSLSSLAKEGNLEAAFKKEAADLIEKYPQRKAILAVFDPAAHKLYCAVMGGSIALRDKSPIFELFLMIILLDCTPSRS